MLKAIRWFVVVFALVIWSGVSVAGLGIAVARAALPASKCIVTQAQIDTLQLEKMSYADVSAKLGCDGVLKQRQDYGAKIVIEDYSWRGDAWPYARFDGRFINGVLHGTDVRWLNLNVSW